MSHHKMVHPGLLQQRGSPEKANKHSATKNHIYSCRFSILNFLYLNNCQPSSYVVYIPFGRELNWILFSICISLFIRCLPLRERKKIHFICSLAVIVFFKVHLLVCFSFFYRFLNLNVSCAVWRLRCSKQTIFTGLFLTLAIPVVSSVVP